MNGGKPWSWRDDRTLKKLYVDHTAVREIAKKLGRTSDAVRSRIRRLIMSSQWKRL